MELRQIRYLVTIAEMAKSAALNAEQNGVLRTFRPEVAFIAKAHAP